MDAHKCKKVIARRIPDSRYLWEWDTAPDSKVTSLPMPLLESLTHCNDPEKVDPSSSDILILWPIQDQ